MATINVRRIDDNMVRLLKHRASVDNQSLDHLDCRTPNSDNQPN